MFFGLNRRSVHSNGIGLERDLSQPKIENFSLPASRHEDVGGLYVAVDDPLRVSGVESIGDLDAQIEHCFDLQRLASNPVPECLPFQQFHRNEGSSDNLIYL